MVMAFLFGQNCPFPIFIFTLWKVFPFSHSSWPHSRHPRSLCLLLARERGSTQELQYIKVRQLLICSKSCFDISTETRFGIFSWCLWMVLKMCGSQAFSGDESFPFFFQVSAKYSCGQLVNQVCLSWSRSPWSIEALLLVNGINVCASWRLYGLTFIIWWLSDQNRAPGWVRYLL